MSLLDICDLFILTKGSQGRNALESVKKVRTIR